MKPHGNATWTQHMETVLRDAWLAGQSASQIGDVLHVTRNAVIGKVNRLGLSKSGVKRAKVARPRLSPEERAARKADYERKRRARMVKKSLADHRPNVIKGVQGAQKGTKKVDMEQAVQTRLRMAETANANARRVPIMDLSANECRWPVNDAKPGEAHLFCGAECSTGKPYCTAHSLVAYRPKAVNA